MNEQKNKSEEIIEIDVKRLLNAVLHRGWIVTLISVFGAVIAFMCTFFLITPLYQSTAMFYVNNSDISVGDASLSISSADITASKSLVDTYIVILNTRETINDVIDYSGVKRSYSDVKSMIEAEAVNETEIFQVIVTSPDPNEAEEIANSIAYILPKRISSIVEGTSAKIVDSAVVPSSPSSPSYTNNVIIGFMLGFILSVGVIIFKELMNITIRSEEDILQTCKYPVLAAVPDMMAPSKGSDYYYGYGKKKKAKKKGSLHSSGKKPVLIGSGISFAAAESYKLLRTKLQFSFADGNDSHVIGVSSALSGEGKSLSAANLAVTLSQLNKKVVLIDCDMRRPTLAEKLGVQKKPGLSSFLTGQCTLEKLFQKYEINSDENSFIVIAAGQNPPNPIELLSSARMSKALEVLRTVFDYVILDLPPVGEVSDAMAVTKETDGILLVVRQNYCDRIVLNEAIRQFEFVDSKIIGVVFNCTSENGGKYGKGYYKRYYKKYSKHYGKYYRRYDGAYQTSSRYKAE